MTVILEGGGFLTGVAVLAVLFAATGLGAAAGVAVVDAEVEEDEEEEGTEGFPAVVVVTTGVEFTNTGSVEGIGFPSLV